MEIEWVEQRRGVGLDIGWRQRRGWSLGGQRQRASIGWSVGEQRLWSINYSRTKKSATVDGNNGVS